VSQDSNGTVMTWANRVTILRMMFIPVFVVALLARLPNWGPWWAAALFALLMSTDAVDGYLARSRNEVTTFGKLIDPLADKLLVTAALVALVDLQTLPAWIALTIISREFIVSGLRMVAVAEGKVISASSFGKTKTVLQSVAIVAFILKDSTPLLDMGVTIASAFGWTAWVVMALALALTIYSMLDYFYHARVVIDGPWNQRSTG